jgi:Flp pilus assembly protein CpaB
MAVAASSTGAPTASAIRAVRGRTRVPGRRAVLGGLLVAVAAVGTFAAYTNAGQEPTQPVVVVRRDVRAGERLDPDDVRVDHATLPHDTTARVLVDPDELTGAVLLAPLEAGEIVQRSAVLLDDQAGVDDRDGHELTLPVDRDRALNGLLAPGELVDVLATYGTGESAYTAVITRRARVIDASASSSGLGSDERILLTLELASSDEILAATHASIVGVVTVVRTTWATDRLDVERYPPPATTALAR